MRVKQGGRIKGSAAEAGGVALPFARGTATAPAVRVKQVDRSECGAAGTGGVLLPLTPSIAAAPAVVC
ncbi:hypothetical protein E1189_01670 [Sansalvadorimonas verongulae]|nr:hypothetical protein [Sansalvadorimonas verongulae]